MKCYIVEFALSSAKCDTDQKIFICMGFFVYGTICYKNKFKKLPKIRIITKSCIRGGKTVLFGFKIGTGQFKTK